MIIYWDSNIIFLKIEGSVNFFDEICFIYLGFVVIIVLIKIIIKEVISKIWCRLNKKLIRFNFIFKWENLY